MEVFSWQAFAVFPDISKAISLIKRPRLPVMLIFLVARWQRFRRSMELLEIGLRLRVEEVRVGRE